MDTLITDFLRAQGGQGDVLQLYEVVFAMVLSLLCVMAIAHTYRYTHQSVSYSQSYVQTLVLTALVTTLIMIVIGSNIARAFSLVGALSIIRFRNPVKETRDLGYIFFAMAIAMAAGTRFYGVAVVATGMICGVMLAMYWIQFGASRRDPERLLRVQLPPGVNPESALEPTLRELFRGYSLILVESVRQGLYTEVTYSVRPKPGVPADRVLEAISQVNDNLKITYHYGLHTDEL